MLSYIKNLKPGNHSSSPPKDKGKAPEIPTAATAPTVVQPQNEEIKSAILSAADERYFSEELEKADEPAVIFPGTGESSGATTPVHEPVAEAAAIEAEKPATEKAKTEEWKDAITTRWDGLKRSVSSAAETHRKKAAAKAAGDAAKKEEKRKLKEEKERKAEAERPEDELTATLEQLNLAAEDGRVFSLSTETKVLLGRFTQIMKDIGNGIPTAYDDLTSLLDSSSSQLESTYSGLPSFLQKFIKTLPTKLEPGLLRAAAAASPALASEGGLRTLVSSPGALMGLLKGVVNVLRTRFPAVLGANAAVSMGLFVVLLVLWYCYKRGKEVRLEGEEKEQAAAASLAGAEVDAQQAAKSSATEGDLQGGSKL